MAFSNRGGSRVLGGRSVVGVKKRVTQWTSTAPETAFIGLAAATAVIDSTFVTDVNNPETIIRIRGLLTIVTDQTASSESPFGAFGVAVVSNQAVAIGVTAVPTPYADAESDFWMYHQFFAAPMNVATAIGIGSLDQQYILDGKAMRKITPDQTLILVMENGHAGEGLQYRLDLRILTKVA